MQGVTTAIVAFIFVCMALPHIVKHRAQFYAALIAILLALALDTLAHMVGGEGAGGLARVAYVLTGFLQIVSIILLVLAAGGLSARELAGELSGAYEVLRRGSEEKELIIPIRSRPGGNPPAANASGGAAMELGGAPRATRNDEASAPPVIRLDDAGNQIADDGQRDGGIPLV